MRCGSKHKTSNGCLNEFAKANIKVRQHKKAILQREREREIDQGFIEYENGCKLHSVGR